MDVQRFARPDGSPLPPTGCEGVEGRVLLVGEHLALAQLRFAPGGSLHPHSADHTIDVLVLEGRVHTAVGDEQSALAAGERVRWPAGVVHRLWAGSDAGATTLMVEYLRPTPALALAPELDARCFCGGVRLRVTAPTEFCGHCHCANCRLAHGAAYVTWTSGETRVRWFESRPGTRWGFCGECGSSLLYRSEDAPGRIYVTAASFPGGLDRAPESHVSWEERVGWLEPTHLPCYRGKTEERLA